MPQPKPKQMTKEKKKEKVEFFKQKIEEYPVVGILDMHNLPAKQLQEIKKDMKEFAEVKMSRTTLMEIAVNQSDKKGVEKLKDNQAIQPAFIFSKKRSFPIIQPNPRK